MLNNACFYFHKTVCAKNWHTWDIEQGFSIKQKWIQAPSLPLTRSETLEKYKNPCASLNLYVCVNTCMHLHPSLPILIFISILYLYLYAYYRAANKRLEGHIYQKATMMIISPMLTFFFIFFVYGLNILQCTWVSLIYILNHSLY